MKFEYKIQRQAKSMAEANTYSCLYKLPLCKITVRCLKVPFFFTISGLMFSLFINDYSKSLKIVRIEAVFLCFTLFLVLIIVKIAKIFRGKFIDADCISTITIEDGIFTKENEFDFLQIPLSKIENIDLLNNEIVINFDSNIRIFIPKDSLPESVNEFIEIFKKENSSLKVTDYVLKIKKRKRNYIITVIFIMLLSICGSIFIAKSRTNEKFDFPSLITQDELKSVNNGNSYLYKNKNLEISIYFPKSWNGHYGINENDDDIEVYYIGKGKLDTVPTLLFRLEKGKYDNDVNLNFIDSVFINYNTYSLYGPTKDVKFSGSKKEYEEYKSMFRNIRNLEIK